MGGSHRDYDYTVHYEVGEITDRNENIRVDRVYNSRPGIALYKTKPDGSPLAGDLCFTLGADGTVTVNTEEYRGWLQVTEDPESGTLTWVLSIENRKPGPVTTEIECFKMLRGRDLGEGEFSFLMTPVDAEGLPVGESIRARNTAAAAGEESRFTFSRTYTLEDYANARYRDEDGNAVFLYLVNEEISPDADENGFDSRTGIVYDRTVYLLQVTVLRDAETGLLNVEKSIRVYDPGMLPLNESLGLLVRE